MTISIIAAMAKNRAIGKDNKLLWHLPEELNYFREKTRGKPVIMGRKTYESIGRLLPKRPNIIITRDANYTIPEGGQVVKSLKEAIEIAKIYGQGEIMIIGGAQVYAQAMPLADKLYLTEVDLDVKDADAFFPEVDKQVWQEALRQPQVENGTNYDFVIYQRHA